MFPFGQTGNSPLWNPEYVTDRFHIYTSRSSSLVLCLQDNNYITPHPRCEYGSAKQGGRMSLGLVSRVSQHGTIYSSRQPINSRQYTRPSLLARPWETIACRNKSNRIYTDPHRSIRIYIKPQSYNVRERPHHRVIPSAKVHYSGIHLLFECFIKILTD